MRADWITDSIEAGRLLPVCQAWLDGSKRFLRRSDETCSVRRATRPLSFPSFFAQLPPYLLSSLRDAPGQKKIMSFDPGGGARDSRAGGDEQDGRGVLQVPGTDAAPLVEAISAAEPVTSATITTAPKATYSAAEMAAAQAQAAKLRASCDLLKGAPKSSRDDPNFVSSFFAASRLHFIGAKWRRGCRMGTVGLKVYPTSYAQRNNS